MSKLGTFFLALLVASTLSLAGANEETCLTKFEKKKNLIQNVVSDDASSGTATVVSAYTFGYLGFLIGGDPISLAGFAVGLFVPWGVGEISKDIKRRPYNRMIQLIEESYLHLINPEGIEKRKLLQKLAKKISRQSDQEVNVMELAASVIESNENLDLCSEGRGARFKDLKRESSRGNFINVETIK